MPRLTTTTSAPLAALLGQLTAIRRPRRQRPARRLRGFSMIELLVVISIVGVLTSLLMPALQASRESGRRSQCSNNMRQIGVALHSFHSTFGRLPSSVRPPGNTALPRTSWETFLLPALEQLPIYNKIDQSENWSSTKVNSGFKVSNSVVVATRIGVFECPSSTDPSRLDGDPQLNPWVGIGAPTDYSTITCVEDRLKVAGLVDSAGLGIMPKNSTPTFDKVRDGLSNTILVAESAGRPAVYQKRLPVGSLPGTRVNGGGWCRPASDYGLDGASIDGTTFPGPCAINCTNGENVGSSTFPYPAPYLDGGTGETYAFHPGGANLLIGDGSVRFAWEGVDIRLFARLVTRNASEIASVSDLDR